MGTHPIFESDFDCLTERAKSDMLDHFNVIIDTITDLLNPFYDIAYPIAVILVLISVIIFAWRSTEVSTADEVDGQFTIPGRGTFNVINTDRTSSTNQNRSSTTRRRGTRTSSTGSQQETEPETETTTSEEVAPDAGDETETEININVRYLDESVMNCSFRPSQSLGHFKLSNWSNEDERKRVCLIYAGKALRDDKIQMRRIGLKEGDTMHAFYKNEPEPNNNRTENGSNQTRNGAGESRNDQFDDDDFDELARYFLPLAGSLLIMTWFYVLSSPIMISVSTLVALLFITLIYTGFAIYNYRSLIF